MKKYRTIVADPPWPYANREGGGYDVIPKSVVKDGSRLQRSVREMGYQGAAVADIAGLVPPSETNAHLYLWVTNAFMVEGHEIARAWGFTPKTIVTWVKTHHGVPGPRVSMKTGYYFRGATEHFIFAVKGSLALQVTDAIPTATLWPRTPHSVKPDAFYDLVERVSPGPYLELFARTQRLGWDTWGNECLNHVELGGTP